MWFIVTSIRKVSRDRPAGTTQARGPSINKPGDLSAVTQLHESREIQSKWRTVTNAA